MFHSTKAFLSGCFIYLTFIAVLLGGSSCTCVHDDYMHCDISIAVIPFFQTPCMDKPSYPEHIKNVLAVITDENGNIVQHQYYADFISAEDAKLHISLPHTSSLKGKLYCTLWANVLYPDYIVSPGVETISGLNQSVVEPVCEPSSELWSKLLPVLYCGTEEIATIPTAKLTEPLYFEKRMNLTRYTNDFNVKLQVSGVTENTSLLFEVQDENLAYFLNGELSNPRKHVFYKNLIKIDKVPDVEFYEKNFSFSTMRLDLPISVYSSTYKGPSFYLKQLLPKTPASPSNEQVITEASLLDWFKVAGTNLACEFEHQMLIQCNIAPSGTHMGVVVWLDNFRVFSYDVEL